MMYIITFFFITQSLKIHSKKKKEALTIDN